MVSLYNTLHVLCISVLDIHFFIHKNTCVFILLFDRDDVRYFCREHPRGPICVSIDWILVSIFHNTKIVPPFPPEPQILKRKARGSNGSVSSNNTSIAAKSKLKRKSKQSTTSSIFRGDVFAVVPLKTVPTGTLDFCCEDMEATVVSHGGLLLTKTLLLAIKSDVKKSITSEDFNSERERKYYVVTPRLVPLDSASPYPLVSEITRIPGIKVVLVNKVWISACVMDDRVYDPEDFPLLFQPQTWSIRLLKQPSSSSSSSSSLVKVKSKKFLISVTGFVDSSRYGITSMLKEIGAEFTDTLSRKNTHLICKQAEGKKYTKALEWGLHVVSIDWLYHIVRYGFDEGSEDRFSLAAGRKHPVEIKPQPATFAKKEKVRSSLDDKTAEAGDALLNAEGTAEGTHLDNTNVNDCNGTLNRSIAELEENRSDMKEEVDVKEKSEPVPEYSPSSQMSSSSHRGKRDPPQASPNPIQRAPQQESEDNPSKRLKFAMKVLSESSQASPQKKRRGKRDKSPKASQESIPLSRRPVGEDEDEESEEYSPQNETQFTVSTILANADIMNARNEPQVPLSALSHVEDNGESQLIWFAGSRR